jgi:hypothetical protein
VSRAAATLGAGLALATAVALAPAPGPPAARAAAGCLGQPPGASPAQKPGPRLRFGITPGAVAGQVGAPASAKPESDTQTMAALRRLAPAGTPFVLRLNRLFWSDGSAGIDRFVTLAQHYTAAGYLVEVQVRYHPSAAQQGDLAAWVDYVREVVRRLGANPSVVGLQITNEVNFTASQDSSDGAYQGAKDALIAGVVAAHQLAASLKYSQLKIGFNWFYRTDPSSEDSFWTYLGTHGGPAFAAAVDWVGLDAYPQTFFPPADTPGGERDAVINALSVMRDCYLPEAGITERAPIYVEENGYPTGPGRSEDAQRQTMQTMITAFHDYRGTYHVSDYRWFNLRDADSSSPNFQQQFGILHDDYSPKAGFESYRSLVASLSAPALGGLSPGRPGPPLHPRPAVARKGLILTVARRSASGRHRRATQRRASHRRVSQRRPSPRRPPPHQRPRRGHAPRCWDVPLVVRLSGSDIARVRSARLTVGRRVIGLPRRSARRRGAGRWRWTVRGLRAGRRYRIRATVRLEGPGLVLKAAGRTCGRPGHRPPRR